MLNTGEILIQREELSDEPRIHTGLSSYEAEARLKTYGPNVIIRRKKISILKMLLGQFSDFMIVVLLASTAVSLFLGELTEALAIIAIVVLNAILGFIQEYRSEKSIEALKGLTSPSAKVIRDGIMQTISAGNVVPGDIIVLGAGDRVPADGILLEANNMQANESVLTGESVPVEKDAKPSVQEDRRNMIFMGTTITSGRGRAFVNAVGMNTEMGKIADMIQDIEEEQTPLQKRLEHLGKFIVYGCLCICAVVTLMGIVKGESAFAMFLSGVSLAVAAIPEGLPAIVTVALAIGVQRMVRKNALVRKLPAVETLGCATVICSDKTGTMTENKMTVRKLYTDKKIWCMDEIAGYGERLPLWRSQKGKNDGGPLELLLQTGVLCNNAEIVRDSVPKTVTRRSRKSERKQDVLKVLGDSTEGAILIAAMEAGYTREVLEENFTRIGEVPFDPERKCMSVICRNRKGEIFVFTKGAPDVIIEKCTRYRTTNGTVPMMPWLREEALSVNGRMGSEALRVLGFAFKRLNSEIYDKDNVENGLTFVGLMGMIDPPRNGVKNSIIKCRAAGIKPVMITGDHQCTAAAVAKELKIIDQGGRVVTGTDIEEMDDAKLEEECENISVYARVSPRHKLRIVRALKSRGHVVAMTGDGVNDAPAVKEADIGISMGISGTDVTKEASSMILTDDNFSTIVEAVEEGRIVYGNIRKFIRYMLSCNIGEVLTMFLGAALGLPLPLLPIQVLWVNLVTDGLPAIALGFEPPEKDIMLYPPRGMKEGIFSRGLARKIILRGILIGIGTLMVFWSVNFYTDNIHLARTAAFAVLCLMQLVHVFECKSERHSLFEISIFSNPYLIIAVICSLAMLLGVVYIPAVQSVFKTQMLTWNEWALIIGFSALGPVLAGTYKPGGR